VDIKVVFIPGNGGGSPQDNWFPALKNHLEAANITVIAEEFPDNDLARASQWLPFLLHELHVDKQTILVGHSSGAIAAMRLAEKQPILGSVLVGAYHTHLNMPKEMQSGYFDNPWDWSAIRKHQTWIALFASQDDPWIPIEQPRHIHQMLNCEYHEFLNEGHFGGDYDKPSFPELAHVLIQNIKRLSAEP
jgi:predicted alpha/beta hydrolase family esterase